MEAARNKFTDASQALAYIMAGRSTVTLRSNKTGTRFTYAVQAPKADEGQDASTLPRFVKVLSGADNSRDYSYVGTVFDGRKLTTTRKSVVTQDAPSFKAFAWTLAKLNAGEMPADLEVWHEGRCGCCGRKLTVPTSIASGIGPTCAEKHG